MRFKKISSLFAFIVTLFSTATFAQRTDSIPVKHDVSLPQAHKGTLEIDSLLLDSYVRLPENIRKFYLEARSVFEDNAVDFTDERIVAAAANNDIPLIAGPMLGDIKENGVSIWLRPASKNLIEIEIADLAGKETKIYFFNPSVAGQAERIVLGNLSAATKYSYLMKIQGAEVAKGTFQTASKIEETSELRLAFASDFHKIGLHNPNLMEAILARDPMAMLLLGDLAVDDRDTNLSMHRSDYLLRDVSQAWKKLAANVPVYATWDDHDYLNNDLSGLPKGVSKEDREALRAIWAENWNNPKNESAGIYFNTRIADVEVIMLDTRSFRENERRGAYNSYLGEEQLSWLKDVLITSPATFKVISSGTMWSDFISDGKDSWGTWDTLGREELYKLIETENIPGVLLLSGDRHGARGFTIPRNSGFAFYEFGPASLGGVPGPEAIAKDSSTQLFGYLGQGLKAFGELTFSMNEEEPQVTFRLIDEYGNVMEEHSLLYRKLIPNQ
ncbi:alkaline phosphatase D family protein [Algoriphagus winogradskyi]|uniref:Alkaline phosphatase D n=1 Tax=Algoriphagus winogradskyi TaxID=237017 RepID=A0ABY1NFI8_9BACT|nr:alkaline phosphatase D family protein [Algoriphagus winogradskyi]SMP08099.1 alkaline phosphatase D [Algoriphagus winogradskyi]